VRDDDEDIARFIAFSGARLLRLAVLLCGDPHAAQDLLQDALTRAYPRWSRLRNGNPEAYLRAAMSNQVVSWWRSPRSRTLLVARLHDGPAAVDQHARADDRQVLLAALRQLPPKMRTVVVLRYWLDLSEQQVAAELGCSPGSVKSQASRGLQRLRAALGEPDLSAVRVGEKGASR
jgi:RNA polymerase sigma-70 factor (sigma-E family)